MAVEERTQHFNADGPISTDQPGHSDKGAGQARQHTGNHDGLDRPFDDLGEQHHRIANRDAGATDEVAHSIRPPLRCEHVGVCTVVDINDRERRVDGDRSFQVEGQTEGSTRNRWFDRDPEQRKG